ncbi:hypothetical protein EJB05_26459, partial [Eragrostis curvula]
NHQSLLTGNLWPTAHTTARGQQTGGPFARPRGPCEGDKGVVCRPGCSAAPPWLGHPRAPAARPAATCNPGAFDRGSTIHTSSRFAEEAPE